MSGDDEEVRLSEVEGVELIEAMEQTTAVPYAEWPGVSDPNDDPQDVHAALDRVIEQTYVYLGAHLGKVPVTVVALVHRDDEEPVVEPVFVYINQGVMDLLNESKEEGDGQ
jgi:hypothetical protein